MVKMSIKNTDGFFLGATSFFISFKFKECVSLYCISTRMIGVKTYDLFTDFKHFFILLESEKHIVLGNINWDSLWINLDNLVKSMNCLCILLKPIKFMRFMQPVIDGLLCCTFSMFLSMRLYS